MNLLTALNIIIFIFGYYIGLDRHSKDITTAKKRLGKARAIITGKITNKPSSGIVYRPTTEKLNEWNKNPKQQEADEALKEILDEVPEIKAIKKQLGKR